MINTKPLVAIVGRPNVGKSTFFNKIAGQRISIVQDSPGVTRDRIYADTEWTGHAFTLIDTGGIDTQSEDVLYIQMKRQAEIAIETADVICFFADARAGLMHEDLEIAQLLRRSKKPVIPVINKVDSAKQSEHLYEYYELGLGDPIGISSANMLGFGDLLDEIVRRLPERVAPPETDEPVIRLALVGRPNVGKSSLANRLLMQERTMVSDIPGTTRDAIDTPFVREDGSKFIIIDTAGIRRKRSIEEESVEQYSVLRSIAAIRRCDVALLVIDAQDGVTEQDLRIAGIIKDEYKAMAIVINKWDAVEKDTGFYEEYEKKVLDQLKFVSYAPIVFVSALTGQRLPAIWTTVDQIYAQYTRRIPTGVLNDVIGDAQAGLQPLMYGGRRLRIYYATQPTSNPPTFILFVNDSELMHFSYERYLENQLRKAFGLEGTPIRLLTRQGKENA